MDVHGWFYAVKGLPTTPLRIPASRIFEYRNSIYKTIRDHSSEHFAGQQRTGNPQKSILKKAMLGLDSPCSMTAKRKISEASMCSSKPTDKNPRKGLWMINSLKKKKKKSEATTMLFSLFTNQLLWVTPCSQHRSNSRPLDSPGTSGENAPQGGTEQGQVFWSEKELLGTLGMERLRV